MPVVSHFIFERVQECASKIRLSLCDEVENSIRSKIPAAELSSIIDNSGLPYSGINLSYSNSAPVGASDADILVTLTPKHHPTADYVQQLRMSLAKEFPGVMFAFLPSDIVTQIPRPLTFRS